ncbi:MAG: extracellular solute-binding protein [Candidatus Omnitrophota bacterium]
MKKTSKTIALLVVFIFILFNSLPACFAREKQITLTFWQLSAKEDFMRLILDDFEKENPNIKVNMQILTWDYGFDKIVTSIAAGNAPDVCELGSTWVPTFSTSGILVDLTDDFKDIKDKYLFWESVSYEGKLFGAPWLVGTRALFYNKDLFKRAGLDPNKPPKTWLDLLDYSKKIHQPDKGIYGFGIYVGEPYAPWQLFLPFAWSNGADVLSPDFKTSLITSPEFQETLEFYNILKAYSIHDRQAQINQAFAEGKVGIQISGAWNLILISQNNPELNYGVAIVPRPDLDIGRPVSFAGGEVFVIFKQTRQKEAAVKLMKFLLREENIMKVVKSQKNVLPSSKESIRHPYFKEQPNQRIFFEQMMSSVAAPEHPSWPKIEEHLTRAIEEVVLLDVSPKEALQKADLKINDILKSKKIKAGLSDKILSWIFIVFIFSAGLIIYLWQRFKKREMVPATKLRFKKIATGYLFIFPWLLLFFIFSLFPLIHSIIISFSDYNLLEARFSFIGFKNYLDVMFDPHFHKALWHTIFFAVGTVPFTTTIALFCALLINRKLPFKQLYQAGLFLPVVTSVIVIASIFSYVYSPDGLLNIIIDRTGTFLSKFGIHGIQSPKPSWLLNTKLALPSIMAMCVWSSFGYYTILFLAGLQAISQEMYEASAIDGANWWGQFRWVILPQLKPIMLFIIVINSIRSFQVFPEIFAMTQGGPLGSTTTVVYHLYEMGFHRFEMGMASAVGYILFIVIMCLTLAQLKIFKFGESVG